MSRVQKLYVIATDRDAQRFRVLKIDRTPAGRPSSTDGPTRDDREEHGLSITEDHATYSYRQKEELLETLRAGNAGLKLVEKPCFGIAGASPRFRRPRQASMAVLVDCEYTFR